MILKELKIDRWSEIIIQLQTKSNITMLCKDNKMTYSHVSNVILYFIKYKWITTSKSGRIKTIKLTPKGHEVIQLVIKLKGLMK